MIDPHRVSAVTPLGITLLLGGLLAACHGASPSVDPDTIEVKVIVTPLANPRGVAVTADGGLLIAEAGTGNDAVDTVLHTGRLSKFVDRNNDGDFVDPGEVEPWFEHLPSYNAINIFATGRDEVSGPSDVLVLDDGRVFLSVDGGFEAMALFEISSQGSMGRNLSQRSNMTGIGVDRLQQRLYVTESTLNRLIEIELDDAAQRVIVVFGALDSGQQAVPAGLAVDPSTGEILVALFSGVAADGDGGFLPFVPGDAKVVRVDPETGTTTDEITGLTTAVDVAVDGAGNIFVVEMAAEPAELFVGTVDLFDTDADPRHGGYLRFSGKVTLYPAGGGPPKVLADGLDSPTNITVGPAGALYISVGQGTPGRPIPGPAGPVTIVGQVLRITGY